MKTSNLYNTQILDCIQDGIIITTLSGSIVYANSSLGKLAEQTHETLLEKNINPLLIRSSDWEAILKLVKNGENSEIRTTLQVNGSKQIRITIKSILLAGESREDSSILHSFHDISYSTGQPDQLQQNDELLQALFANAFDALFIINPQTKKVINCNDAAIRLLEAGSKDQIIGDELLNYSQIFIDGDYRRKILDNIDQNGEWKTETTFLSKKGRIFWGALSVKRIRTGQLNILLTSIRDIHDRKISEEQLTLRKAEIESANQKLTISEENYRLIVEKATDIIYSTDVNGLVTYSNETLNKLLGIERSEGQVIDLTILTHPDYKEEILGFFRNQFQNRIPTTYYEFPIHTKDNRTIWIGQNTELHIKNNWVIGFQCVARDITERKKSEAEKEALLKEISERELKINAIIDNTQDGIWAIDNLGRITVFNEPIKTAWPIFTGQNISIGFHWLHHLAENQSNQTSFDWIRNIRRVLKGESFKIEQSYEVGSKTYFSEITINPILNAEREIAGAIFITHDITSHKDEEKDLKLAKTMAEASVKAKEQFLSVMSHEIRTPMNAILGMSHLLGQEELNEGQKELLQGIRFSAENLLVIINDILDFSKIEAGGMTFENIDFSLEETVKATVNTLNISANNKGLPLICQIDEYIPPFLKGDPTRLNQILTNLIGNAIKFTYKGMVNVNVRLLTTVHNKNIIRFDIADTGIGIPEDKLGNIFDSFTQGDTATTRKFGGTGLGLSITKKLIQMQGGRISVSSNEGTGSVFSFEIAYETGQKQELNYSPNTAAAKFDHLKVLLVEDNKMNQLVATKLMQGWDVDVTVAESGFEAIEFSTSNAFDIILMDLQMPELDGFQTTKILRTKADSKATTTPIIALTASVTGDVQNKCQQAGMNDYISKPIDPIALNNKLQEYGFHKKIQIPEPEELQEKVTDLAYMEEAAGGSSEFMESMIDIFLKQTPEFIEQLHETLAARDWTKMKALAHKIRPTYISFGINSLKPALERLEWICQKEQSLEELPKIIKEIEQTSEIAYNELTKKLAEL